MNIFDSKLPESAARDSLEMPQNETKAQDQQDEAKTELQK